MYLTGDRFVSSYGLRMGQIIEFVPPRRVSRIEAAISGFTELELFALIKATHLLPRVPRSLFEWIESVCDWELDRRAGIHYSLVAPGAMMSANEAAMSLNAAKVLRLRYGTYSPAERALFEAVFDLLAGVDKNRSRRA